MYKILFNMEENDEKNNFTFNNNNYTNRNNYGCLGGKSNRKNIHP